MQRRSFLVSGLAASVMALPARAQTHAAPMASPVVLTITGSIEHTNRDAMDPALDQLMHRHQVQFSRAFAYDYASLVALPADTLSPTLSYDGVQHDLRGPRLDKVLSTVGAHADEKTMVSLRAVDGYVVSLSLAQVRARGMIVATHIDGLPLPLGGLGPLWAVCDPRNTPELAARELQERYNECPWALYHIDVHEAA